MCACVCGCVCVCMCGCGCVCVWVWVGVIGHGKCTAALNLLRRVLAAGFETESLLVDQVYSADYWLVLVSFRSVMQAVHLAGGKAILMKSKPADGNLSVLVADNACVLLPRTKEAWGLEVSNFLEQ